MANDLNDLRKSLDNIDNALVYLLAERFRITHKVGLYKRDNQLPPVDESREAAQFERIKNLAEAAELNPEFAQAFLRLIIDEVVREHKQLQQG